MLLFFLHVYVGVLFHKSVVNKMSDKFTVKVVFWTSYNMAFFLSLDLYGGIRRLV